MSDILTEVYKTIYIIHGRWDEDAIFPADILYL